jgi:hypothetical protein
MTLIADQQRRSVTARPSMSWYLRPSHPLLKRSVGLVDALTVSGCKGTAEIRRLRDGGFSVRSSLTAAATLGKTFHCQPNGSRFRGTSDLSGEFSRLPVRTRGELERGTGVLPEWG